MEMLPTIYRKIIKLIILISLLLILAIIFFEAGKAAIVVKIKSQDREINFATAVTETGDNNTLPGRILFSAEIEKSKKFTTPASEVTENRASGEVTIYNHYSANQQLVATTRLLTPTGLIFRITESVNVPAGGEVKVMARADQEGDSDQEGEQYLIGPTKFTIPGLWVGLQDKIYAESKAPMTYQKISKYQITEEVYNNAKEELINEIKNEALTNFKASLKENETIKEDALAVEITEEKSTAKINEEVKEFEITLKAKVKTLAFNENDLRQMIANELSSTLEAGDKVEYDNPQMALNIELYPTEKDSLAVITGQYQVKILNANIDLNIIKGLPKNDAENTLLDLPNVESAQVNLWPFWVTKVPSDEKKIELTIN